MPSVGSPYSRLTARGDSLPLGDSARLWTSCGVQAPVPSPCPAHGVRIWITVFALHAAGRIRVITVERKLDEVNESILSHIHN
jgi:hypothetical protein